MEDCRRSSIQTRMSKNILKASLTHTNKIIAEPKLTTEDSIVDRLIQQKKQLVQEHSHQMLYKEQRIKSLENEISIIGIKYQRLKKDYEQVIEGGNAEMVEELKNQNDGLVQRVNEMQATLEYIFDKVVALIGEKSLISEENSQNNSVSSLSPSMFVQNKIDQLQKVWIERNQKHEEVNLKLRKCQTNIRSKQAEIKLLNQHLIQTDLTTKKLKTTLSTLQKVLEAAQREKKKILDDLQAPTLPISNVQISNLSEAQIKKLVERLIIKQKQLATKNLQLMEQVYLTKEEEIGKLEGLLEKFGKYKEQRELEIIKLKNRLCETKNQA